MKQKIMTEDIQTRTLAIKAALAGGGSAGEFALAQLANEHGDNVTQEIVEGLSAAEIALIAGEFDATIPSLVHAYSKPEQFAEAFLRFGQRWPTRSQRSVEIRARQNELEAFLVPMLCGGDEQRNRAMLGAFGECDLAVDALVFIGIGRPGFEEAIKNPAQTNHGRMTFEEIYHLVNTADQTMMEEIKTLANALPPPEDNDFCMEFCKELAEAGNESQGEGEEPEERFLNL